MRLRRLRASPLAGLTHIHADFCSTLAQWMLDWYVCWLGCAWLAVVPCYIRSPCTRCFAIADDDDDTSVAHFKYIHARGCILPITATCHCIAISGFNLTHRLAVCSSLSASNSPSLRSQHLALFWIFRPNESHPHNGLVSVELGSSRHRCCAPTSLGNHPTVASLAW